MLRLLHLTMQSTVIAVAMFLACPEAQADQAVLLASTVPGYVPGMVVAPTDHLSVPDGATATLLFESGEMLQLRGPFEGTLSQQHSEQGDMSVTTLVDMFRLHGVDATVIGGTRSTRPGQPDSTLDEVQVDPQRSGTYCIEPATSVWITRPSIEQGVYTLRRMGRTRTLGWPPGANRIEWPADVPVEDGSQFGIGADTASGSTITFRAMPPTSGAAQVAKGLVLGCHDQFEAELAQIRRSVISPGLWITTDRGRQPSYPPGEPIGLSIMANVDGYLYCVVVRESGNTTPVFPSGALDGAQLRGSAPLSIPGRRQPIGLTASSGLTRIHCWLADRDITPELPHALLGPTTERLPDQLAADLEALFSHISGTRIASDALTIKTESATGANAQ